MEEMLQLNEMIRDHCRGHRVRLVDASLDFEDDERRLKKEFSHGDGGHLNAKGYRHLGRLVGARLADILKPGKKVACLGDSITEGYPGHANGQEATKLWDPYTKYLERPGLKVLNFGLSGDTTDGMMMRFFRDVLKVGPDVCIVLGGTNDLLGMVPPAQVMENLAAIYSECDRQQVLPVAVTVLPID